MPSGSIATAILGTPAGPLSVLAHGEALVGAGFTGDPGELHARLHRSLRPLPLVAAELATRVGLPRTAARAAGAACAANLVAPVVPCHRVLRSDGSLGGYYYGLARKRWLLHHEGAA